MSLTKVSYSMIKGAGLNVLDYGAYNDGTHPTETAAAIQAAITAAASGNSVLLPAGTYAISSTLTIPQSNFEFYGQGRAISILRFEGSAGSTALLIQAASGQQHEVRVHDLTIDGNSLADAGMWVKTGGTTHINSIFENIELKGTTNSALWLGSETLLPSSTVTQLSECVFNNFYIHNIAGDCAVRARGCFVAQICSFTGFTIDQTANYGIHIEQTPGPLFFSQSSLGGNISAVHSESTFSLSILTFVQCYLAEGIPIKFFQYGPNNTQSAFLSFFGVTPGGGSQNCFDFRGHYTSAVFNGCSLGVAIDPSIIFDDSGGRLFTSGCYVNNPYTTIITTPNVKVFSTDFGSGGNTATFISKRLGIDTNNPSTALQLVGTELAIAYKSGNALNAPSGVAVVAVGTTGASTWSYLVTGYTTTGETTASSTLSLANGNATLDGTNYNQLSWSYLAGCDGYNIYRTAVGSSPATFGYIGSATDSRTLTFQDTGLGANGVAAPAINTTNLTDLSPGGVKVDVVATGSLPAANALLNGRVLVENAGGGAANLIVYANNSRFRIAGGVAF